MSLEGFAFQDFLGIGILGILQSILSWYLIRNVRHTPYK